MTSLVSDFIINPVLRQARRFSSGFATDEAGPPDDPPTRTLVVASQLMVHEEAVSASEDEVVNSQPTALATAAIIDGAPSASTAADDASSFPGQTRHDGRSRGDVRNLPSQLTPSDADSNDEAPSDSGVDSAAARWTAKRRPVLPEDDGMGILRQRILTIQSRDIPAEQKALLMHHLLMEGYTKSQLTTQAKRALLPESPSSQTYSTERSGLPAALQNLWNSLSDNNSGPLDLPLTDDDLRPTYAPPPQDDFVERIESADSDEKHLGCEHYRRNVKLQCVVCERWYTCRLCHDEAETHVLPRYATRNMLCMLCGCAQRAGDTCVTCGESAAHYYCGICKLWNDNPNKPIYHCNDCGLCRIGQGIGKDFFHCSVSCRLLCNHLTSADQTTR